VSADIYGTPRITKLVNMMQTLSTPSLTDSLALDLVQSLSGALDRRSTSSAIRAARPFDGTRYAAPPNRTATRYCSPAIDDHDLPVALCKASVRSAQGSAAVASFALMPIALIIGQRQHGERGASCCSRPRSG
jgi:hypothetical protein